MSNNKQQPKPENPNNQFSNTEPLTHAQRVAIANTMSNNKQQTAITSLIILIGIIIICIGVVNSKVISIAVMAIQVLVFAYFCIYSTILRNKKQ